PRWLRRVVEKGLDRSPERRFRDFHQIARALEVPPRRAAWKGGVAVCVVGVAAVVSAAGTPMHVTPSEETATPCAHRDPIPWAALHRARLRSLLLPGLREARSEDAPDGLAAVDERIDRYVTSWRAL